MFKWYYWKVKKSCKNENDFTKFFFASSVMYLFFSWKQVFLYCAVALSLTRFSFELSLKTSAPNFLRYALTQQDNKNYESFQ